MSSVCVCLRICEQDTVCVYRVNTNVDLHCEMELVMLPIQTYLCDDDVVPKSRHNKKVKKKQTNKSL